MAKDALFFSHDLNARNDKKIAALVREFKSSGYGIYWCTVEMMHEEGGVIELDELTFGAIAHDLNEDIELVKNVILRCVDFKLFVKSNVNELTAIRVMNNLVHRDNISKSRSKAGQKGAIAKQEQANAKQMPSKCEANDEQTKANDQQNQAKKERKKERDNNNNEVGVPPSSEIGSEVVLKAAGQAWDDQKWREQICMANYLNQESLKQWMYMYNSSLTGTTDMHDFSASKYKRMFNGWLQAKINSGYKLPEKPKPQTSGLKTLS
jgi:hypothetical protein